MSQVKIRDNLQMIYNSKIDSRKQLENLIMVAYTNNVDFFEITPPLITITFVYSRQEMDKVLHRSTRDWEVGYAYNHGELVNQIAIFSPMVFEKVSTHTKENFIFVLTHELTHIFTNNCFGLMYPVWLREGLAGYVARQYERTNKLKVINDFIHLHDKESWNKNVNYPQAYLFTKYLMNRFTENKMKEFFKVISNTAEKSYSNKIFENSFEKFFQAKFSSIVMDWRETVTKI